MSANEQIYSIFNQYAAFGSGSKMSLNSMESNSLDNARFSKFAKEAGIIDKLITTTEIDITFNKVKGKGERRINFETFLRALDYISQKKYPNDQDAYFRLINQIIRNTSSGPNLNGSTAVNTQGSVYEKLTNTAAYTGTQRNSFDSNGKGVGTQSKSVVGATLQPKTGVNKSQTNLSKPSSITSLNKMTTKSTDTLQKIMPKPTQQTQPIASMKDKRSIGKIDKFSNDALESQPNTTKKANVFDRLNNVNSFTGSHKERFNADGTGKGMQGRDSISKSGNPGTYHGGDVKELSQILRK